MTTPMKTVPRNLPAPATAAVIISRLLTTAASQIGYREGANNDNAFGLWYGTNRVSWCAQFVSWAAFAAGIPSTVIPKHQYTPTGWNWFTAHDRDVASPKAGDIFYVYGYVSSEGRSRVHHVGIVEKVLSGGRIQTIEGNTSNTGSAQGNGVYRLVRTVTSKLRFARPDYQLAVRRTPPSTTTPKPPTQEDDMPYTEEELKSFAGQGVHGQRIGRSATTIGVALETILANSKSTAAEVTKLSATVGALKAELAALKTGQTPARTEG